MEEDPRNKTLKCKCDLISCVVIIMHVSRFDLVNSILAHGIDFRMFITCHIVRVTIFIIS